MNAEELLKHEPGEYTLFASMCFTGSKIEGSTARRIHLRDESVYFLHLDELIQMKGIIERTIRFYEENGISEDVVDESNKMMREFYRRCDEEKKKRAALYSSIVKENSIKDSDFSAPRFSDNKTNIYVIRDPSNGTLKVGQSLNPQKRLESFRTSNVSELSLVYTHKGRSRDENILHHILKCGGYHVKGEWFIDSPDVIDIVMAHFERREKG